MVDSLEDVGVIKDKELRVGLQNNNFDTKKKNFEWTVFLTGDIGWLMPRSVERCTLMRKTPPHQYKFFHVVPEN
jgi:hypothetical protein